jgi:hypothetical protein
MLLWVRYVLVHTFVAEQRLMLIASVVVFD